MPVSPVPIVKAFEAVAVTVTLPPNDTELPLMVIALLVNPLFGIVVLIALAGMLIVVLPASVMRPQLEMLGNDKALHHQSHRQHFMQSVHGHRLTIVAGDHAA